MCRAGNHEDIKRGFQEVQDKLGKPSVLVYNAGPTLSWPPPGILEITPESLESAMGPGVFGALYCAQEVCSATCLHACPLTSDQDYVRDGVLKAIVPLQVLPDMVKAGEGTILYTGATASLRGSSKFARLAVPKFALRALAQSMAREFQPQVER